MRGDLPDRDDVDGARVPQGTRLRWPDVAKGLCIMLVVLHHVVTKHVVPLVPVDATGPAAAGAWVDLTYALKPVRMPLFFMISGFLSAGVAARAWPALALRVASSAWLYLVWLGVLAMVLLAQPDLETNRIGTPGELLGDLVLPSTALWFLWALGAYLLVARCTRGLPAALVLAAAGALTVVSSALPVEHANRESALAHLLFFLLGARLPGLVRRWGERPARLPAALVAYVCLAVVVYLTDVPRGPVLLVLAASGLPLGLAVAARLGRTPAGRGLAWVGRRTLPVYLLHLPVIGVLVQLALLAGASVSAPLGPAAGVVVAVVYPVLATLLVCGACLVVHHLLQRIRARWLFALPAPVAGALRAWGDQSSSSAAARRRRNVALLVRSRATSSSSATTRATPARLRPSASRVLTRSTRSTSDRGGRGPSGRLEERPAIRD